MSNDEPSADADPRSDQRSKSSADRPDEAPAGARANPRWDPRSARALRSDRRADGTPAGARSVLSLLPWRNFRRVLFLIVALVAVVTLKRSAGGFFRNLVDSVTPAPAHRSAVAPGARPTTTVHIQPGSFAR